MHNHRYTNKSFPDMHGIILVQIFRNSQKKKPNPPPPPPHAQSPEESAIATWACSTRNLNKYAWAHT